MSGKNARIINQYYALSFMFSAGGMSIISAIYVTYLLRHGLNLFEVNLVNAIFYVTLFTCEIPTGAFADVFGRKASFVTACALLSLSMIVYGISSTFAGFVLAEMIGAVGSTFRSGAFQAWLVDSLKHQGYEGQFNHIFGRESVINKIGGGLGALLGSYLTYYNSSYPWYYSCLVMFVCSIIAFIVMKESYFIRVKLSWLSGFISMRDITKSSIRYGVSDKSVRFILLMKGFQIFAVQSLNMYWQPYFKENGLLEYQLGYLYNGMMIALALGSYVASRYMIKGREDSVIVLLHASIGLLIICSIAVSGIWSLTILFILHEVPRGCLDPYMDNYIHKRVPSSERATILSFCSIAHHVGGAIGLLASGVIAQFYGIGIAWLVSGIFLIVVSLLMLKR